MIEVDKGNRRLLNEEDPVFGVLKPLKLTQPMMLPTYQEVGQSIAFDRAKRGLEREKSGKTIKAKNKESYDKFGDDILYIHQD